MDHSEISQAVWECANQQIYDLKREVTRLTLLERDYLTEIDSLQIKHSNERKDWQNKTNALEEEKRATEQSKTKFIEELELALLLKHDEVKTLTKQLEAAVITKPVIDNSAELQDLTYKVQELEENNAKLEEENNKMRTCMENLKEDIQNYQRAINDLQNEYSSLTENYKSKVEDLNETKEMIETLQDELMTAKTELEIVKGKSVESNSQGNSLFAEVDEKRLQLQTKVNKMRNHYEQMKRQITRLEEQVFKMRAENGTLKYNWQKEIEERANDKYDVEDSYKNRIDSLESLIKDYKTELESRPIVSTKATPQEELAFIEYRIELKNVEIQKLLDKISRYSLTNMLLTERSKEAAKEASMWQHSYISTKGNLEEREIAIAKLEERIREMEIASVRVDNVPSPAPEIVTSSILSNARDSYVDCSRLQKRSCSILQECKEVTAEFNQSQKENQISIGYSKKKVQFTEETKEDAVKSKSYRRGGKTIICQPTVLKKKEF